MIFTHGKHQNFDMYVCLLPINDLNRYLKSHRLEEVQEAKKEHRMISHIVLKITVRLRSNIAW